MTATALKVLKSDWRLPIYLTALLGSVIFVVSGDLIQTLVFFLVAPALVLVCIILLLCAAVGKYRRNYLWAAGAIGVFLTSSVALVAYQRDDPQCIRSRIRWILQSHRYKPEVLAQAQRKAGELKHIEWDGWGFVPAGDTTMYLVYDPSDALLNASRERKYGVVPGIPCPVERVHRLETQWYTVLYPTDSRWATCAPSPGANFASRP